MQSAITLNYGDIAKQALGMALETFRLCLEQKAYIWSWYISPVHLAKIAGHLDDYRNVQWVLNESLKSAICNKDEWNRVHILIKIAEVSTQLGEDGYMLKAIQAIQNTNDVATRYRALALVIQSNTFPLDFRKHTALDVILASSEIEESWKRIRPLEIIAKVIPELGDDNIAYQILPAIQNIINRDWSHAHILAIMATSAAQLGNHSVLYQILDVTKDIKNDANLVEVFSSIAMAAITLGDDELAISIINQTLEMTKIFKYESYPEITRVKLHAIAQTFQEAIKYHNLPVSKWVADMFYSASENNREAVLINTEHLALVLAELGVLPKVWNHIQDVELLLGYLEVPDKESDIHN